ncbi:ferredoxin--NADP reductase [Devosia sp.]|uniref:ferredoxin--NADP reductase n=1 Tax=Devosia sp. TaxID=1871048 RepID=UPI003A8E6984
MIKLVHPIAGGLAILTIAIFWLSTVISELSGSQAAVVAVKTMLPWGFLILVPSLAAVGGSGLLWSRGDRSGRVGAKLLRMPFIAANGLLVLMPSAFFLAARASAGTFDVWFYGVQALELVAGAINLTLLGLSLRDGLRLTRWRRGSLLKPGRTHRSALVAREDRADGISSFRFERPPGFEFTAGQAAYLTLLRLAEADARGRMRVFSLSGAPNESTLEITTRLGGSAFKRSLATLPIGAEVELEGPYGDLTLAPDRPAILLAGGIGITPFRSMVRDALARGRAQELALFYSVSSATQAAFADELTALAKRHPRFSFVPTISGDGTVPDGWAQGRVSPALLARHVGQDVDAVYYVAGPPAMVEDMETMLLSSGVTRRDIRVEAFTGY